MHPPRLPRIPACFNEAGDFHPQKVFRIVHDDSFLSCFNEAGDFHPQKEFRAVWCKGWGFGRFNEAGDFHPQKVLPGGASTSGPG